MEYDKNMAEMIKNSAKLSESESHLFPVILTTKAIQHHINDVANYMTSFEYPDEVMEKINTANNLMIEAFEKLSDANEIIGEMVFTKPKGDYIPLNAKD